MSFAKKTALGAIAINKAGVGINEHLAEKFYNQAIKEFKRGKFYARFKDNIWAADLSEVESLTSKNENVKYLSCIIDAFTKYGWVK